jgi:hypothetical protein
VSHAQVDPRRVLDLRVISFKEPPVDTRIVDEHVDASELSSAARTRVSAPEHSATSTGTASACAGSGARAATAQSFRPGDLPDHVRLARTERARDVRRSRLTRHDRDLVPKICDTPDATFIAQHACRGTSSTLSERKVGRFASIRPDPLTRCPQQRADTRAWKEPRGDRMRSRCGW